MTAWQRTKHGHKPQLAADCHAVIKAASVWVAQHEEDEEADGNAKRDEQAQELSIPDEQQPSLRGATGARVTAGREKARKL